MSIRMWTGSDVFPSTSSVLLYRWISCAFAFDPRQGWVIGAIGLREEHSDVLQVSGRAGVTRLAGADYSPSRRRFR